MPLMFLYTIVPAEIIFGQDDECNQEDQEVEAGGVRLLVRADGTGGGVITRLLSTDPRDFLDPRWQPGQRIRV